MRASYVLCLAAVAGVVLGTQAAFAGLSRQEGTRSVADRVFSAEQADRGRTLFRDVCIICHPDPLWRTGWEGRSVGDLYTKILKFMPDDAPGSLSQAEAASAVAYILQGNGFPPGDAALPTDVAVLSRIRIDTPPK